MFKKSFALLLILCSLHLQAQTPKLVINEVSNGSAGEREYIEFLVTGPSTPACQAPSTLDLRNWIFDDNNGYFGSGSGKGIAQGAFRFKNIAFWSAIPVGTLIVIYNVDDYESSLITNDISMNDGNCKLVIPCTSNLLESQSSSPSTNDSSYPSGGWSTPSNWSPVGLRNGGDGVLIFQPGNLTTPVHSFAFGDVTISNADISFSGNGGGKVYSMKNTSSNDFYSVSNWVSENATNTTQTPGLPNNTANENYILSLSNNCQTLPVSVPVLQTSIIQNTTCNLANGSLGSNVTGGNTPISYSWSNGAVTPSITNVPSGSYRLIVTDASGCKDTSDIVLAVSNGPSASLTSTPPTCGSSNGSVTSSVTGGTTPYTYAWSNGGTSSSINNVASGNFKLIVTDNSGCKDTAEVTLHTSNGPAITLTPVHTSCGLNNGTISATVSNGVLPYSYTWSNGGTGSSINTLSAGTYKLIVTDAGGCKDSSEVTINSSSGLTTSITKTDVSCNANPCDGSVSLAVSGGTLPYQILWNTGASSSSLNNICAGEYRVTVQDAAGCEKKDTIEIGSQGNVILNVSPDVAICNGGSATLTASGATTYNWSNNLGTGTSVIVSPSQTTTYTVTGTSNNCSLQKNITVTVNANPALDGGSNATICQNGTYTFNATGADNYTWSNGISNGSNETFTSLGQFTYYVTGTTNGCIATDSVIIIINDCNSPVIPSVLEMPNVFTPNSDGSNDTYKPTIEQAIGLISFTILNRWGNIMYIDEDIIEWNGISDGKEALPGTYFYLVKYKTTLNEELTQHGFFELVR